MAEIPPQRQSRRLKGQAPSASTNTDVGQNLDQMDQQEWNKYAVALGERLYQEVKKIYIY